MCSSVKDTNKILENERSRNVVNALIIDALGVPFSPEVNKMPVKWLPQPNNLSKVIVVEFYAPISD